VETRCIRAQGQSLRLFVSHPDDRYWSLLAETTHEVVHHVLFGSKSTSNPLLHSRKPHPRLDFFLNYSLCRTIRRCFHNFILFQHPIPLHIQYSNIIMTLRILLLPVLVLILFWGPSHAQNGRFVGWNDRFTYEDQSIYRSDGFVDWSPIEWDRITCNEGKKLDECMAYIDKWESGRGWKITRNDCDWCPEGSDQCGRHHQSPVNLLRETGLPLDSSNDLANECIDLHWIKYEDSLCTFQQLKERNAFTIERHALRTSYPLYFTGNAENAKLGDIDDGFVVGPENTVHLDCPISGRGPRFPRMGKSL
jgi:hypothetical protein